MHARPKDNDTDSYINEAISQAGLYYVEVSDQNAYVGDGTDYTISMSYISN